MTWYADRVERRPNGTLQVTPVPNPTGGTTFGSRDEAQKAADDHAVARIGPGPAEGMRDRARRQLRDSPWVPVTPDRQGATDKDVTDDGVVPGARGAPRERWYEVREAPAREQPGAQRNHEIARRQVRRP